MKEILKGNSIPSADKNQFLFCQLMNIERNLKALHTQENIVRSHILELHVEKVSLQRESDSLLPQSRPRSLFTCGIGRDKRKHAKRAELENQLDFLGKKLTSKEQEQTLLIQAIKQAQLAQVQMLETGFAGCRRYECKRSGKKSFSREDIFGSPVMECKQEE